MELLSPAGNYESLEMSVQNGCDAVYLGGKKFGARAFSSNFTNEEIKDAIMYCHLYDVKVYVTVNTIVYDDEIKELMSYVKFLYENGVDAILLQDYGMIDLIHQTFPDLVIHASTQMNIHTVDELKKVKELGFKRVVLAREVNIETIKQMKKEVDIELEVFVHGALCVSASGQCLMSYMVGKRSANRGECAGICRQPYTLYSNKKNINISDKYLLSTKDLCLIDKVNELKKIGVDSIKIEGRMKSKEYVASVTKAYRYAIDNKDYKQEKINMFKMFNRDYTLGNLYNKKGKELINGYRPNHMGYLIGEVIKCKNGFVTIKLQEDISQYDGIRFITDDEFGLILNKIYKNKLLVNSAKKGEIISLKIDKKIKEKTKVYKTLDKNLIDQINKDKSKRYVYLFGNFYTKGKDIIFCVNDLKRKKEFIIKNVVQQAKSVPTKESDIYEKLNKTNNSPFKFNNLSIKIDNSVFIPMTIINNLKREVIDYFTRKRTTINKIKINKYEYKNINIKIDSNYIFDVQNENQLKYILDNTNYLIYIDNYKLYKKYENNSRILYKYSRINPLPISLNKEYVAGEISKIKENTISDVYFNVVNAYAVNFLHKLGSKRVTLSYELSFEQTKYLISNYKKNYKEIPNLEVIVYGKPEVMVSKYCLLNTYLGNGKKNDCNICKKEKYYLKDKFSNNYEIKNSNDCYMRILDYKNINTISNIKKYKNIGVNNFRFVLNDEDIFEIEEILKLLTK